MTRRPVRQAGRSRYRGRMDSQQPEDLPELADMPLGDLAEAVKAGAADDVLERIAPDGGLLVAASFQSAIWRRPIALPWFRGRGRPADP